jgi:hypothetical protein
MGYSLLESAQMKELNGTIINKELNHHHHHRRHGD